MGSVNLWHAEAQGLAACWSNRSRTDCDPDVLLSASAGTMGGGGGGSSQKSCPSTHAPRRVGKVRLTFDVTVSQLPCMSSPSRCAPLGDRLSASLPGSARPYHLASRLLRYVVDEMRSSSALLFSVMNELKNVAPSA